MATILVADDDPSNRLLLATILEARQHVVLEAAAGEEALALAVQQRLDLVVLDLHMPGIHGADLVRRLRAHPATAALKIVVSTATSPSAALERFAEDEQLAAILPKPCEPEEIIRIIDDALAR
jgi:CheY-like chemotaxis protein